MSKGFQAGLSWLTILRKRANFRRAFSEFDPVLVAGFSEDDVARLKADVGIVRHEGKMGLVNDHLPSCFAREECEREYLARFGGKKPPTGVTFPSSR